MTGTRPLLAVTLASLAWVPVAAQAHDHDSAFHAMQARGSTGMGVDQYTSSHQFDPRPDGGRIALERDVDDSVGVAQIRRHLEGIARAFAAGDFRTPMLVHDTAEVPGTRVMAARRDKIRYEFRPLPKGGEIRITTGDVEAIAAIHEFLAFQRREHRTSGER